VTQQDGYLLDNRQVDLDLATSPMISAWGRKPEIR
jgi:hypothetical protein